MLTIEQVNDARGKDWSGPERIKDRILKLLKA